MRPEIKALFGDFTDAYTVLVGTTTNLDPNDTALVLTEQGNLQLFLPENKEVSDRGLALVEIYNAMCRDKAGPVNKDGSPIPDNVPYQGFTEPYVLMMKSRVAFNKEKLGD
tara:strand:- start:527 stop:859 length:333 start_codon:yes stop_codon:yes gene_type:complete